MPARCAAAPYTNLLQQCGVDRLGVPRGGGNFHRSGDAISSVVGVVAWWWMLLAGMLGWLRAKVHLACRLAPSPP